MKSRFPSIPGGRPPVSVPVDLDELMARGQPESVWLETKLYEGATQVYAPDFEAPTIWDAPELSHLECAEIGESLYYAAYVEYEMRSQWSRIDNVQWEDLPLNWMWQQMPVYKLSLAIIMPGATEDEYVFSFAPQKLVRYPV